MASVIRRHHSSCKECPLGIWGKGVPTKKRHSLSLGCLELMAPRNQEAATVSSCTWKRLPTFQRGGLGRSVHDNIQLQHREDRQVEGYNYVCLTSQSSHQKGRRFQGRQKEDSNRPGLSEHSASLLGLPEMAVGVNWLSLVGPGHVPSE
jgi:hypothetical protein